MPMEILSREGEGHKLAVIFYSLAYVFLDAFLDKKTEFTTKNLTQNLMAHDQDLHFPTLPALRGDWCSGT